MRRSTSLLGLLLEEDGWLLLEDLEVEYSAPEPELREVAIETVGIDVLDLGEDTLLVHPMKDNREAVAALFDEAEAEYREAMDWAPRKWGDSADK